MNLGHSYETRFWYFLGVFSKFSDGHPVNFTPRGSLPVDFKAKVLVSGELDNSSPS